MGGDRSGDNLLLTMRAFALVFLACLVLFTKTHAALSLKQQNFEVPERGVVQGYCMIVDTNSFSFVPPVDSVVTVDETPRAILVTFPEKESWLEFKFLTNSYGKLPPIDSLRLLASKKTTTTNLLSSGTCYTAFASGVFFDFEKHFLDRETCRFRVAYVPYAEGMIQLTMFVPQSRLLFTLPYWGSVLNSLTAGPRPDN